MILLSRSLCQEVGTVSFLMFVWRLSHIIVLSWRLSCCEVALLKRTRGPGGHQVECELAMCPCGKDGQTILALGQRCQQVQGGGFSPWLSSEETTSGVLCLVLGSPVEGSHGLTEWLQKRAAKTVKVWRDEERVRELGLCSLRKSRLQES